DSQAALEALTAGGDMDMADGAYMRSIPDLVKSGKLPEATVDEAVRRVLRVKFRAGLVDHPYGDANREKTDILTAANREVARNMAFQFMVVLQNKDNLLPLNIKQTISIIDTLANAKYT